ncbi:hypothetical protein HQ590_11430 [bacterium]|nr:hypothetical protein [bacterium]
MKTRILLVDDDLNGARLLKQQRIPMLLPSRMTNKPTGCLLAASQTG